MNMKKDKTEYSLLMKSSKQNKQLHCNKRYYHFNYDLCMQKVPGCSNQLISMELAQKAERFYDSKAM